jgi:Spy/CpxP family protein refolding chaperone
MKIGSTHAAAAVAMALALVPAPAAAQHEAHSPHAGTGSSEVKTLTPDEVAQLLEGEGMGLARPAEMNGYPGPRHVLDLADSLALTPEQAQRTREIFETMNAEAVALGRRIVDGEKALDALFASGGAATEAEVEALVADLAEMAGELRLAHLKAHLAMTELLTEHQRHEYARLRGYGAMH